jgi:hypothetical protein
MRTIVKRLGCLLGLGVWLVVMLAMCVLTGLIVRHELSWERGWDDADRLYLIQERYATGIGYSSQRPLAEREAGVTCVRSTERLLLWNPAWGAEEYVSCSCSREGAGGSRTPVAGDCGP